MKETKNKRAFDFTSKVTAQGLTSRGLWGAISQGMNERKIKPKDTNLK